MPAARILCLAVILAVAPNAAAAQTRGELRVWTTRALATVLAEIGSQFERDANYRLTITSDLPPGFARRASTGESFDVFISGLPIVDQWINDGRVLPETRTTIARSGIGVEVRAGAAKPDIHDVDALKRALLAAKSVAYLQVGSGIYVDSLVGRLGIADAIKSKVTRPETDIVSELVAKGEVELGIVVITQILTTPGVELVGPLPPEIQSQVTFVAGISSTSATPEAARQLV